MMLITSPWGRDKIYKSYRSFSGEKMGRASLPEISGGGAGAFLGGGGLAGILGEVGAGGTISAASELSTVVAVVVGDCSNEVVGGTDRGKDGETAAVGVSRTGELVG
jgi:hypothetical protein